MQVLLKVAPVVLMVFLLTNLSTAKTDISFDRIEVLNDSHVDGCYDIEEMRITKFNRSAFVLNAEFETLVDIDDTFSVCNDVEHCANEMKNGQLVFLSLFPP